MNNNLLRVGAAATVLVFAVSSTFGADPVTFGFEATVTEIVPSADVGFALPTDLVVGGVFDGLVTFEPPVFFGRGSDGASLQVEIGSVAFRATDLPVVTAQNFGGTTGNSTSTIRDTIDVGCTSATPCLSSTSNIPSLLVVGFDLSLADSTSPAINSLFDRVENPDVWNQFSGRRLVIELASESSLGLYQVIAEVGPVSVIPEPSALCQALFAVIGLTCGVNRRKHLRKMK